MCLSESRVIYLKCKSDYITLLWKTFECSSLTTGKNFKSHRIPCKVFCGLTMTSLPSCIYCLSLSCTSYPDNTKCSQARPYILMPLLLQVQWPMKSFLHKSTFASLLSLGAASSLFMCLPPTHLHPTTLSILRAEPSLFHFHSPASYLASIIVAQYISSTWTQYAHSINMLAAGSMAVWFWHCFPEGLKYWPKTSSLSKGKQRLTWYQIFSDASSGIY